VSLATARRVRTLKGAGSRVFIEKWRPPLIISGSTSCAIPPSRQPRIRILSGASLIGSDGQFHDSNWFPSDSSGPVVLKSMTSVRLIQIYHSEQISRQQRVSVGVHDIHAVPCHTTRRDSTPPVPPIFLTKKNPRRLFAQRREDTYLPPTPQTFTRHPGSSWQPGTEREYITFISM
jgi:hypothetical protein